MANKLEIKHVADLKGLRFRVPSYQRGYRWERKQIEQLLDDLLSFQDRLNVAEQRDDENGSWNDQNQSNQRSTDNLRKMGYYCLQPLAVVSKKDGSGEYYDIIDGQQRLTTIYLILHYLDKPNFYFIEYESRDNDFFKKGLFATVANNLQNNINNIDFYFMTMAYQVIKKWFEDDCNRIEIIKGLLNPQRFKENGGNDYLHDVRFIWYETPATTAIKTFSNLNYGKIGLTASELVKALLFECDRYEYEQRPIEQSRAFSRSMKWSAMEESLQDKYFWGMLHPEEEDTDLHLEFILKFVAGDIDEKMKYSEKKSWSEQDPDWVFNILDCAIAGADNVLTDEKENILSDLTQRVDYIWNQIQKVYTVFKNWYEDRTLYHQIGLYVFIHVNWESQKKKSLEIVRDLYELYVNNLKSQFAKLLKKKIGESVKSTKQLEELKYGQDDKDIRKILLLFNVEVTIQNTQEEPRFPFHIAAKNKLDSLEHIHPQNLNDYDIKFEQLKAWYEKRRNKILESKEDIKESVLQVAVDYLNDNLADEETFKQNEQNCRKYLQVVDSVFDELANMKPEIMHSIRNLALVDKPTNSALSNGLIDEKRNVLKERSKVKEGETEPESYVPLGTWYAFNKYYSSEVDDLKFWTEHDRNNYFNTIKTIYEQYTKNN